MEIEVSRSAFVKGALIVLIVVLIVLAAIAGVYFLLHSDILGGLSQPTPTPEVNPAAQAATAGVEAFYTLDYQEPMDAWAERVCAVSTESGCEVVRLLYLPAIEQVVSTNNIQTGCTTETTAMVDAEGEDGQVWRVHVILTDPWPGTNAEQDVYVFVVEDEQGEWMFDHILFDEEAAKYQEAIQ